MGSGKDERPRSSVQTPNRLETPADFGGQLRCPPLPLVKIADDLPVR